MNRHGVWLCILAVALACDVTDPEESGPVLWEADIRAIASANGAGVSGEAAGITRPRTTELSIGVTVIPPGIVLRWGAFSGTCDAPGDLQGAPRNYTTLSGAETTGEGVISVRLERGDTYHIAVMDDATDERLGCGPLLARGQDS